MAVLQGAHLVASHGAGREVIFTVQPERLTATASWMTTLAATWEQRLEVLKQVAEAGSRESNAPPRPRRTTKGRSRDR